MIETIIIWGLVTSLIALAPVFIWAILGSLKQMFVEAMGKKYEGISTNQLIFFSRYLMIVVPIFFIFLILYICCGK